MPCLTPLTIENPKYRPNSKNNWTYDIPHDPRLRRIQVPCGKCVECRRRRASDWRFRMQQEYKYNPDKFYFITMTFNDESLEALLKEAPNEDGTYKDMVTLAIRRFLERYRKQFKVSLRHLFVTELGGEFDRIHIHGVIMGAKNSDIKFHHRRHGIPVYRSESLSEQWKYGFIYLEGCADKCISYILKYIMKQDSKHPDWKPLLLVSPGLGKGYVNDRNIAYHHSVPDYVWYCLTNSGWKVAMPRYYKLKLFTDEEREARTLQLLDDPPPLTFHGKEFESEYAYRLFVENYYRKSLRIGTSHKKVVKSPRIILENCDF